MQGYQRHTAIQDGHRPSALNPHPTGSRRDGSACQWPHRGRALRRPCALRRRLTQATAPVRRLHTSARAGSGPSCSACFSWTCKIPPPLST